MLKDFEIRRFLGYLRTQAIDNEQLLVIEDELRSEIGNEIIREPEFLRNFKTEIIEFENWELKIIPYTKMRMIQRGITLQTIINLFSRFIEKCESNNDLITLGAYTIFGKFNNKQITLRLDVDSISDEKGEAHTVTVFVGSGNTENTFLIALEQ
jgi:hypothetical protein